MKLKCPDYFRPYFRSCSIGLSYCNCTVTDFNKGYPPQSAQGEHKEYYDKDDEQGKQRARRDGAKKAQVIARNKLEKQFGTR